MSHVCWCVLWCCLCCHVNLDYNTHWGFQCPTAATASRWSIQFCGSSCQHLCTRTGLSHWLLLQNLTHGQFNQLSAAITRHTAINKIEIPLDLLFIKVLIFYQQGQSKLISTGCNFICIYFRRVPLQDIDNNMKVCVVYSQLFNIIVLSVILFIKVMFISRSRRKSDKNSSYLHLSSTKLNT